LIEPLRESGTGSTICLSFSSLLLLRDWRGVLSVFGIILVVNAHHTKQVLGMGGVFVWILRGCFFGSRGCVALRIL